MKTKTDVKAGGGLTLGLGIFVGIGIVLGGGHCGGCKSSCK
jgi:hypothetical protein